MHTDIIFRTLNKGNLVFHLGSGYRLMVNPAPNTLEIGYHLTETPKGIVGDVSKITEEVSELVDAAAQGVKIMELVELSDIYGAMELYLESHHPGTKMADLAAMSFVTRRAFTNGRRR